jgi:ABC-2 type transport system permease protein
MSLAESYLDSHPAKFGLGPSVWRLLLLRVRIWWNSFKRAKLRGKIGAGVLVFVAAVVMVGLFFLSRALLSLVGRPELAQYLDPRALYEALPTMILSAAFAVTIFTNFGVLLQSLYMSRDMDFLVTSPLPMRAVFLAKLLEAILPNFALFCAISLPVLFGLGASNHYGWVYYPLILLMLAMLALAAGGLASILVMAVVRVVSARRATEILGVVGAMISILCGQSGNLMNAMGADEKDFGAVLSALSRVNTPWSPLAWAGQGLTAIGRGQWWPGLPLSLLAFALAAAIFTGTLWLAESLYYTGWSSMQASPRKKRAKHGAAVPAPAAPSANPLLERSTRLLPSPVRGMLVKDFLLLRRDPRNLSQLITPLIFGFIMLFSLTRGSSRGAGRGLAELGLAHLEIYGLIVLAIFVGWMLLLNLSSLAFTREGRSYWMIKASPIPPGQLIFSKYTVSYLPALAFCLAYLGLAFAIRQLDLVFLPFSILVVALSMAGATAISLTYGIAGANLDWDGPHRQRLTGSAGCMVFIVVSLYLLLEVVLFLLPPGLWQVLGGGAPWYAYAIGLALGSAGAVLGLALSMWVAFRRIGKIGEA